MYSLLVGGRVSAYWSGTIAKPNSAVRPSNVCKASSFPISNLFEAAAATTAFRT